MKKLVAFNIKFMTERKKRRLALMVASEEKRAEAKKQMKNFRPPKFEGIPNYDTSVLTTILISVNSLAEYFLCLKTWFSDFRKYLEKKIRNKYQ